MTTPFIRDGKLVKGALDGIDRSRLSAQETHALNVVANKSMDGKRLQIKDMDAVLAARSKG